MSRRLFAACRQLDQERAALAREVGVQTENIGNRFRGPFDEDAYDEQVEIRRSRFAELEDDSRERIRTTVREEYEAGQRTDWTHLLNIQPPVIAETAPALLEGVTPDTYVAIDTQTSA